MKTQYYTAMSLDGYIADADHSLGWLDEAATGLTESSYPDFIRDIGALAMGSSTYEWMLRNHIYADPAEPKEWPYTGPTWVFSSRTLTSVPGANVHFVSGEVAPVHRAMVEAAEGKNVWVVGGGDLAGQFHDQGLLDELIIQVAPVTLGSGAPLLPRRISSSLLHLRSVERFGSFVELRYAIEHGAPAPTD